MAEDIVVRYKAEVDEALRKLDAFAKENEQLASSSTKAAAGIDKTTKATDKLEKELQDTGKSVKGASKSLDEFGKKGSGVFDGLGKQVKSFAAGAALALGAAFSVDAIIQFGKASIDAFLEAEKNAERLKFAITTIGGESEAAFDRLIRQSSRMQEITVFSDDSIQQAQAALSAFGLTADEIERTIPLLADYATVTGQDVVSAVQQIGAGMEGAGREFKKYGIEVSATATRQENLNNILQGFGKFIGAAENATKTYAGQLAQMRNELDDTQEIIGQELMPLYLEFNRLIKDSIVGLRRMFDFSGKEEKAEDAAAALATFNYEVKITTERLNRLAKENGISLIEKATLDLADAQSELNEINKDLLKTNEKSSKQEIANLGEKQRLLVENSAVLRQIIEDAKIAEGRAAEAAAAEAAALAEAGKEAAEAAKKAAAKAAEERIKEYERLKKAIEDTEFEITQNEKDEIAKRDAEFFKSLEKKIKALEDMKARAKEAQDILTEGTLSQLETAPRAERIAFADTFEKETLADTEREKARLAQSVEDYEDYTNQVVILEKEAADKITAVKERLGVTSQQLHEADIAAMNEAIDMASKYADLLGDVAATYAQYASGKIEEINRMRDAELEAIDASLEANEVALDKRRISEKEAEETKKKLLAARVQAEEEAAKKERAIKRKQFNLDKAASIAQIGISMAEAFAKTVGKVGGVAGVVLAYAQMTLLGVQLGLALAQPNPYKKGTKRSKSGLALVGEEGPELTYLPQGAKVLPKDKTNRYSEVIDAMYDGKLDEFIKANYMAPALRKEKAKREVGFAANVARAAMINPDTGVPALTYYDMEALRKKGTRLTDDTIERLADALSRRSTNYDPYRR